MSYPGPPGVSGNLSHPSLPPRPPQPSKISSGFKPAFSAAPTTYSNPPSSYPATTSYGAPPSYGAAGPQQYGAPSSTPAASYSSYPSAPPTIGASYQQPAASYNTYQATAAPSYPGQPQSYYGAAPSTGSYSTPAAIRNPFPAPASSGPYAGANNAHNGPDLDPETAAQIAQWQSAYMPKDTSAAAADPGANAGRGGNRFGGAYNTAAAGPQATSAIGVAAAPTAAETAAAAATAAAEKKKTVIREGGGKKWADDSLLEWDPTHLRLFVGNLAGETTDESLLKAFSRWSSVQKAKVVRDKRTTKSKGYGFVSFSDPDDFFQAAKEMNGKYIQSHPVVVHKAKTEIKPQVVRNDKRGKNKWNKKSGGGHGGEGNKSGSGAGKIDGAATAYEPNLGPHGGGVTKPGQKTRGGLKILG